MSRGPNKTYSKQFREQAMDLVRVQKMEPTRAARELGMPFSTLILWLKRSGWIKPVETDSPLSEEPTVLKVQVVELQKQVRRLEMEKEILKKATAYFASLNP